MHTQLNERSLFELPSTLAAQLLDLLLELSDGVAEHFELLADLGHWFVMALAFMVATKFLLQLVRLTSNVLGDVMQSGAG